MILTRDRLSENTVVFRKGNSVERNEKILNWKALGKALATWNKQPEKVFPVFVIY